MEVYFQESEALNLAQNGRELALSGIVNMSNTKDQSLNNLSRIQNRLMMSGRYHSPDMLTLLVEDFHARTLALRGGVSGLQAKDPDFGLKCLGLYGRLDLNTSSLKTAQLCLFEGLSESYATFPRSGIMQNGNVYQTSSLGSHTKEKEFMLLPTPTKSDYKATFAKITALNRYLTSNHQIRTMDILCQKGFTKLQRVNILEMVMGFDIGHTELEV